MTDQAQAHKTGMSILRAVPAEVNGITCVAMKIRVSCSSACDLWGKTVKIMTQAAVEADEVKLVKFDGTANETEEFVIKAPTKPGVYTWTAVFQPHEKEGISHEESSAPFSFTVESHLTSIKVWDVPDTIAFGAEFKIKVGVKCSDECKLTSKEIEIYDHEGARMGTGTLGDVPWSETSALYWAEVELEAPDIERRYTWTVKFPEPDLELPHEGASCTFTFGVVGAAEHVVTVEGIDKDTKRPIENAHVVLLPLEYRGSDYRALTNKGGVAKLAVPKGEYRVHVTGDGKESDWPTAVIDRDVNIKTELSVLKREWYED